MRRSRKWGEEEARVRGPSRQPRVGRSPTGRGVYATRRYNAEDMIGEIDGTVIDDIEYGSDYCMDMGDARCLEPAPPFRFMNHSCVPNCMFQWYDVTSDEETQSRRRVFVVARDDIEVGEQLTIDYAWPAHMAIPCHCREPECRGWVVAAEELPLVGVVESSRTSSESDRPRGEA